MNIETLITLGYYLSSLGFLIATIITAVAVRKFGQSILGSIFSYLFIGTAIFFVITIFQQLGTDFFMISEESMSIWWHIMFYLAMLSYFLGFKALVDLAASDEALAGTRGREKIWTIFTQVLLVIIFIIPSRAEPIMLSYITSKPFELGMHEFVAFLLAAAIGSYLFRAKSNIGQIGSAIAKPMIIAIWALSLQHFWELLTESWKVIAIPSANVQGVENIFLTIAAISVTYAGLRLKSFANK
jgi:hypothetical protein